MNSAIYVSRIQRLFGKRDLILAERARIGKNTVEAIKYYESAIEEFKSTGSLLFEAFALEKFALFWHNSGMKKLAKMCFIESAHKWSDYGSNGKRSQVVPDLGRCMVQLTNRNWTVALRLSVKPW
ncbi:hypothetical protein BCR33DRAFT_392465 [Rhizoclosmatium globosum]|uniref:Uncharacterized protein n=1 Tax=Rhizoclosmatium globosum TaxID=329046 RepID=A0A1Y2BXW2_9FUNG|nr:hypothetical protein BCR33DRAFT_392465 [Rhizoclosmatium globosum]|eukprot:ORY39610.1 hypothetical protein BCR33DRAFT_392465 [Rhizoclosmatium globosum]